MRARAGWALAAAGLLLGSSCAEVVSETRRERGPLMRSYERQAAKLPAGLRAEARAQWPSLELRLVSFSVCRTEMIREYPEEVVTERSAPGAGPSIAMGTTAAAVGAGLLLFRGMFSGTPNTSYIDSSGRYGPSSRQVATVWGFSLLGAGLASDGIGALGLAQSGESVSQRAVDQVSDVRESRCDERPVNGKLAVLGPSGPLDTRATKDGKVALPPEALKGAMVGLELDGQPVSLEAEDSEELEAFRACARALPLPDDAALAKASAAELILRLEETQRCGRIAGAGGPEAATRLTGLLQARAVLAYQTPDEATAALAPTLTLTPDSADLAKLSRREPLEGAAARVRGTVAQLAGPNLALLSVGPQKLFLEVEGEWPESPPQPGQALEAVGVVVGRRTVGEVEAPLVRAVFVRTVK